MRGSIRIVLGFLLVFGAVGGMDADPNASLAALTTIAVAGLLMMYSGIRASEKM